MSKLENISALLVATNSVFTKEAAFTTKTTRAELIRMLQATDFAVLETLEVAENYVKVSDQLFEDKEKLSAEVQELKDSNGHLENKLKQETSALEQLAEYASNLEQKVKYLEEKCSGLEAKLVDANQRVSDCNRKTLELEFRVSEQQTKLVAANKELAELADSKQYTATLQHQVHKYKQQGFFDRLFGRTPE